MKELIKMFRESFIDIFKRDKRVRMNFTNRYRFIKQVDQLEKDAIRNA